LNNSYFFLQKTAKLLSKSEVCSLEIHLVNMGGNIPEFYAHFRSEGIFQKKKKGDPEKNLEKCPRSQIQGFVGLTCFFAL
jgi:hypothetical protein